jgi:hypothetical protein
MTGDGKANISTDKTSPVPVNVEPKIQQAFQKENITQDFGFIIVDGDMKRGESTVVAFVAADKTKHHGFDEKKPSSAQSVVTSYNKEFEDILKEQGTSQQQGMGK